MNALLFAIAWAGLVMLYDFTMWTNGPLERWYFVLISLPKLIGKPAGLCKICCCFWFGIPFYILASAGGPKEYVIFLGVSQAIIIPYHVLILILKK